MQEGAIKLSTKENQNIKNKEMNISPQEGRTVHNILDTHVIVDEELKEEIVMQEEENSIKNDYLPANMTANVNVEETRVQKLSLDESEGGTKLFNLTLGHILRENDVNSSKADKKVVSKDITKEDNTLTGKKIMIQNEKHIDAQEQKLYSYTVGRNADLSGPLLLRADKFLTTSTAVHETYNSKGTTFSI